jgi:hypothetical protein
VRAVPVAGERDRRRGESLPDDGPDHAIAGEAVDLLEGDDSVEVVLPVVAVDPFERVVELGEPLLEVAHRRSLRAVVEVGHHDSRPEAERSGRKALRRLDADAHAVDDRPGRLQLNARGARGASVDDRLVPPADDDV